jgi:hypothetical protein
MKPEVSAIFKTNTQVCCRVSLPQPSTQYDHSILLEIEKEIENQINQHEGAGHEVLESRGNPYTKLIIVDLPQEIKRE